MDRGLPHGRAGPKENPRVNTHDDLLERFVLQHTSLTSAPLVPEISLHLASDSRHIFQARAEFVPSADWPPYWAFAWPGGQALARHILDNARLVAGKTVLDIGSGSGISAIAAKRAGATRVTAADPDPMASLVIGMNARHNGVDVTVSIDDVLSSAPDEDLVLIADLVYEPELATRVTRFLEAARSTGTLVILGDRTTARRPPLAMTLLGDYGAPLTPALEEGHFERARVWRLDQSGRRREATA
jgi:predicted nicotinamide N-methyase